MFCKQCGKQIDDDSIFCRFCGCSIIQSECINKFERENKLRDSYQIEYAQSWEDLRHRNTIEMTILSVFFATSGALLSLFFIFYKDYWWTGFITGPIGFFFVLCILFILFGERRAWSADVARLKELELLLSLPPDDIRLKENEITEGLNRQLLFECHWIKDKDYKLNLLGSYMWFIIIVASFNLFFGGLFGLSCTELHPFDDINILYGIALGSIVFICTTIIIIIIIWHCTVKRSKKECIKIKAKYHFKDP